MVYLRFCEPVGRSARRSTTSGPTRKMSPAHPRHRPRAKVLPHDRDLGRASAEQAAREDVEEAERTLERAKERAKKLVQDLRGAAEQAVVAGRAAQQAEHGVELARTAIEALRRKVK